MKKITIILTAFIAALIMSAVSVFAQVNAPVLPNDPAVVKGKLPNGMTYYIRHNEKPAGRAEFYLATNVGAIQEEPDQDGLAHFLEHMCFNGTKNFPDKQIIEYLESIGASFGGNINAQTGVEETSYMLNNIPVTREGVVDTCLLIMHDYSHFVTNDPVEIDKERGVILEERRSRRDANWRMHEKSLPYLYGDSKYATCTLIGLKESLENFKPESLHNFYKTWYRPDMQAIIVVGDVEPQQILDKITKIFSDIPAAENPKAKDVIKIPDNKEPIVAILTDPEASNTNLDVIWKRPSFPEELNNTVVGFINGMMNDIIYLVMAERFTDISKAPNSPFLNAYFFITNLCETMETSYGGVVCKDGESLKAFKSFLVEVEKAKKYGFTDAEIDRAKQNIISAYETAAKSADTRSNSQFVRPLIDNFFDNEPYMEPEKEFELAKQISMMLSSQMINSSVANFVSDTNMVVIYKAPEKAGLEHPTKADILDVIKDVDKMNIQPNQEEVCNEPLLNEASLKGGKIVKTSKSYHGATEWKLSNGVRVVAMKTDFNKGRVIMKLSKDGGSSLIESADLPVFDNSIYSAYVSDAGVSNFSSSQLSKMLSGKDVNVSTFINKYENGAMAVSSDKDMETAMQLLYLNYMQPRFDAATFDNAKAKIAAFLPNMVGQPNYKFNEALIKNLYGENHERHLLISEEVLEQANLAALESNFKKLFNDAAGLTMIVVGDFDEALLKEYCEKYIGSIPAGKHASKWIDRKDGLIDGTRAEHIAVDMQTPQTTVFRLYSKKNKCDIHTEVTLSAIEYILNMIYVDTLREDEGGTYGASVSAYGQRKPHDKVFISVYFNTKPSACDKLCKLATEGIEQLAENGPTEEQFAKTIENFKKNIPESRISNTYWMNMIEEYLEYGYDRDEAKEKAINSLKPEDITKLLRKILSSGNFVETIMSPDNAAEEE